jgi:hypothetical protein
MREQPDKEDEERRNQAGADRRERILLGVRNSAGTALIVQSSDQMRQLDEHQQADFFVTLKKRFEKKPKHYERTVTVDFDEVEKVLKQNPTLLWGLYRMEETGGQPDIIEEAEDEYIFADCSVESPMGRCDLTYDEAVKMAEDFGMEMFDETAYLEFQKKGTFDSNSQSWAKTSESIRCAGHALYGYREKSGALIGQGSASHKDLERGWRGIKRIPKKR